ncbi:hypothetical protein VF13_01725 [Nostoc linckia z16]|nr:hypothetical protein VF12_00750 [Nostoc linckia z15]PHK48044.1 hypothetical protein VF13_01725 [Nostoc linckia z16]
MYDKVKVIDRNSKYFGITGHVTDNLDYSIRVMFRTGIAPKNNRGRDLGVDFSPSKLELISRPTQITANSSPIDKTTHKEASYREFWVSVHERPIQVGIKALAICSLSRDIRIDDLHQNLTPTEVWDKTTQKIDALIEQLGLDIPPHQEKKRKSTGVVTATQKAKELMMESNLTLSVLRRVRSDGLVIYQASVPWQFVAQFFMYEDPNLPASQRANRALNPSHAKKIKNYILSNPNYYFPPMVASIEIDKNAIFTPFKKDAFNGILEVPLTVLFRLIDGQHRTWAIRQIMQSDDGIKYKAEFISVDLIVNASLELRKKIFREVNSEAKSVSKNLTTFYNDSPIGEFANSVLSSIPLFVQFAETEKSSLGKKSDKLLIYKHLYDATVLMKPGKNEDFDFKFCQAFWESLIDAIAPWQQVLDGDSTPDEVRELTIASHGVTIHALGELGKYLREGAGLSGNINGMINALNKLSKVDWNKSNPDWLNRVIDKNGGMLSKRHNVKLMFNYFRLKIGAPLKGFSQDDKDLELLHIGTLDLFAK